MRHHYHVFGLTVASDLALPECHKAEQDEGALAKADLEIVLDAVPQTLGADHRKSDYLDMSANDFLLRVPGLGRFRASEGRVITLDLNADAAPSDVRAYLLGSAMGAILHQRHEIPLHVSAVASPRGLIAFTGASGAGKSTLVTALHVKGGWPILTDDLAVLADSDNEPQLRAGLNRVRLWDDAIETLALQDAPKTKVVARENKFQVDLGHAFSNEITRLAAVVLLVEGETTRLERITGATALVALANSVYRPQYGRKFNDETAMLTRLSKLASSIDVYLLERPRSVDAITTTVELILNYFGGPKDRKATGP